LVLPGKITFTPEDYDQIPAEGDSLSIIKRSWQTLLILHIQTTLLVLIAKAIKHRKLAPS
jgi:hypothetical protein